MNIQKIIFSLSIFDKTLIIESFGFVLEKLESSELINLEQYLKTSNLVTPTDNHLFPIDKADNNYKCYSFISALKFLTRNSNNSEPSDK